MTYAECLSYLDRLGNEVLTLKFGLDTIRTVLHALGNPHLGYRCVLIAGTNGKGSVAHFLSSILTSCGVRTATYTSPHIVQLEERIRVDGELIQPAKLAQSFSCVVEAIDRLKLPHHPTYFETLTAVAFFHFHQQQVEVAVLEVGMGGRLDSTNVVDPILSILTSVGLDHQRNLGSTLGEIAFEKAGILHAGCPALTAPQKAEVHRVFMGEADKKDVDLEQLHISALEVIGSSEGRYGFRFRGSEYRLKVHGEHQIENAALAVQASHMLRESGLSLEPACINQGVESCHPMGRIQVLGEEPVTVLDGAHNPDAVRQLRSFLELHTKPPRALVFSMMRDKDIAAVAAMLSPCFERIYLTHTVSSRVAAPVELKRFFPTGIPLDDPLTCYRQARESMAAVVVAGSFYLVGEILKKTVIFSGPRASL